MNLYIILIYIHVTLLVHYTDDASALTTFGRLPTDDEPDAPKMCTMERAFKMVGYICSNLNLKEVPQNLRSGLEVFDLSTNRIRELTKQSFARYSDIKFLYLFDNMIQFIEKDTFSQLTGLEAIDLSTNGIRTIPIELFQLPRLRNLYVHDNDLLHLDEDLKIVEKPIQAPLQYINIAQSKLRHIPDFGILPDLWRLNVSSNSLTEISHQEFSPFCNLRSIDINDTHIPPCQCQTIAFYLRKRGVTIQNGITCDTTSNELLYCTDLTNSTNESDAYLECTALQRTKQHREETKITWISIAAGLFGFFLVFMAVLYFFHRRNVKRSRELKKIPRLTHIHQTESGNREVLLSSEKT